jgi:predicted secreted protein
VILDEIVLKRLGFFLITVLSAIITFLSYLLGHFADYILPELAVMIATILSAGEVLLIFIIRHYFKISDKDLLEIKKE